MLVLLLRSKVLIIAKPPFGLLIATNSAEVGTIERDSLNSCTMTTSNALLQTLRANNPQQTFVYLDLNRENDDAGLAQALEQNPYVSRIRLRPTCRNAPWENLLRVLATRRNLEHFILFKNFLPYVHIHSFFRSYTPFICHSNEESRTTRPSPHSLDAWIHPRRKDWTCADYLFGNALDGRFSSLPSILGSVPIPPEPKDQSFALL